MSSIAQTVQVIVETYNNNRKTCNNNYDIVYMHCISYEPLTIPPVAAQCNGACGKGSSIECVHIDQCWPQKSSRWRLRSTLNLDSDKFRCFNHRDEFDNTVFLPNFRLVALLQSRAGQPLVTMMRAIYNAARKASFIYPQHYVSQENT